MDVLQNTLQSLGAYLPNIIAAVVILVVGWLVAALVARLVRKIVGGTRAGAWMAGKLSAAPDATGRVSLWASRVVFWLIMLFTLVAFFGALQLMNVSTSVQGVLNTFLAFIPRLVAALLLGLVAWVVASTLRAIISRALVPLDHRVEAAQPEAAPKAPLSKILGDAAYWLTFLLFLPAILGALAMGGILQPVQDMVDKVVVFLPNIFVAAIILVAGWFFARVLSRVVASLLAAVGTDRLMSKAGLEKSMGTFSLSRLIGLLVYVLVLIPVVIASLDALQLQAITRPASDMLHQFLAAIPSIFAAGLVLVIAFVVGRLIAALATRVLEAAKFDALPARLGLGKPDKQYTWKTPSQIVGLLIVVGAVLLASVTAANILGFASLSVLIGDFLTLLGRVVLGLVILGVGLFLANLAARIVRSRDFRNAADLAVAAKAAVIVLSVAIALRTMGVANDIIALAFGLSLGAIAVAVAIAFGVGGRDLAARKLDKWDREHLGSEVHEHHDQGVMAK